MKAIEWQEFFTAQREQHGKVLFSVAELANSARTSLHAVNTELGRLVRHGLIARYAQGIYGAPRGVEPEDLVRFLDPAAYTTGFYALFLRHVVTQIPTEITCFTNRRHNRSAERASPAGRLRFVCVPARIYNKPLGLVSAEQALCDFFWLMVRDGLDPDSLVTFRNLQTLNSKRLAKHLKVYPKNVRQAIDKTMERTG